MPTRKALERLAEQAERDRVAWQARADAAERQRDELRRMAAEAVTGEVLHKRLRSSTIDSQMDADHRLAISKGHRGTDQIFKKAIGAKGYTQNALAKAIGVNQAVLSLHRKELRRIPLARAKDIQKLTGWPADAKHWPCGIVTDGE